MKNVPPQKNKKNVFLHLWSIGGSVRFGVAATGDVKLEFHDADTNTDILARILGRM